MEFPHLNHPLPPNPELPAEDVPVDGTTQNLVPNLLLFLLMERWAERQDWCFGVNMAIYHTTGASPMVPMVPEGFLSVGVERRKQKGPRADYKVWKEKEIMPLLVLEVVSHLPRGEYLEAMGVYARMGVLYYVVYNPVFWRRDEQQPFEVYRLEDGVYQQQIGEPYWMPEVGLGIGRYRGEVGGFPQEYLTWFEDGGRRLRWAVEIEKEKRERLEAFVRSQGFDPNNLPDFDEG